MRKNTSKKNTEKNTFRSIKIRLVAYALAAGTITAVMAPAHGNLVYAASTGSEVADLGIEVGKQLIEDYVPGGKYINIALDKALELIFDDEAQKDLTNKEVAEKVDALGDKIDETTARMNERFDDLDLRMDILDDHINSVNVQLTEMREEIRNQFDFVRKTMSADTKHIENKIVTQSMIAGNGKSLDALMTSLEGVADQIDAIAKNTSLTAEEKAIEISALIGKNSQWNRSDNFYFGTKSLMDMLRTNSFMDTHHNRDFFQTVLADFEADRMFAGEAMDDAKPYIERAMLLNLYSYTISMQCMDASRIVSNIPEERVEKLSKNEQNNYRNTVSLEAVVTREMMSLTDKFLNTEREDSVMAHFKKYTETNRRIFVNRGLTEKELSEKLTALDHRGVAEKPDDPDDWYYYKQSEEMLAAHDNRSALTVEEENDLASYVRSNYPGKSMREYLTYVGFDLTDMDENNFLMVSRFDTDIRRRPGTKIDMWWKVYDGVALDSTSVEEKTYDVAYGQVFSWCEENPNEKPVHSFDEELVHYEGEFYNLRKNAVDGGAVIFTMAE